jgi:hypothetical protein
MSGLIIMTSSFGMISVIGGEGEPIIIKVKFGNGFRTL